MVGGGGWCFGVGGERKEIKNCETVVGFLKVGWLREEID